MSRLTPLIARRPGSKAVAIAMPSTRGEPLTEAQAAAWLDDLRLFATIWLGGVVFFATFLG